MCLGIPGRIVEIVDDEYDIAKVEVSGVKRNISIALVRQRVLALVIGCWCMLALL